MWIHPETLALSDAPLDGYVYVIETPCPLTGRLEKAVPDGAELVDGNWHQRWAILPLTGAEMAQVHAAERANLAADVVSRTQQRLDAFAKTRNYDGILSACTYATSAVPAFAAEGQHCVDLRDATWARLYHVLAEVNAGTRPVPGSFADIEPELPVLRWPE